MRVRRTSPMSSAGRRCGGAEGDVLRRLRGRLRLDRRRLHGTVLARARRRRPCLACRSDRRAWGGATRARRGRAGRSHPAARPTSSGLHRACRAARSCASRRPRAADRSIRVSADLDESPVAGGGALVAGAASARVCRCPRDRSLLSCRGRAARCASDPSFQAAAAARVASAGSDPLRARRGRLRRGGRSASRGAQHGTAEDPAADCQRCRRVVGEPIQLATAKPVAIAIAPANASKKKWFPVATMTRSITAG